MKAFKQVVPGTNIFAASFREPKSDIFWACSNQRRIR